MGAANRFLAKFAKKIFVAFPLDAYKSLPSAIRAKLVYTGLPVGSEFRLPASRHQSKTLRSLGEGGPPAILITGGSQGAHQINELIKQILLKLLNKYHLIHLSGELDYPELDAIRQALPAKLREDYELYPFTPMAEVIHRSDLVVSRAGAVIFEMAAAEKTMVLIPLQGSANNHQYQNAKYFADRGAAVFLKDKKIKSQQLLDVINALMASSKRRSKLAERARQFDQEEAAGRIASFLLN
jgi:UDP-N-acetylglucosamine--N-acetylmuramyl-(pentapeptide) pyrophosphoryl-undecaprenol N-acetylglucosamine transferase